MAFTTEFVMGAGGAEVEEIPVSMSGNGSGTVHPLTTVDAGGGAMIFVAGSMSPGSTQAASRPYLQIGSYAHDQPHTVLTGPLPNGMIGGQFTGSVQVAVQSRSFSTTTFTGTVYVARL